MTTAAVGGFLLAIAPAHLLPGTSFALMVRWANLQGRSGAWRITGGTVAGLACHLVMATAGISALVARSPALLTIVQIVGAAFIVVLGVRALRSTAANGPTEATVVACEPAKVPGRSRPGENPWLQAILGNLLNPKPLLLYLVIAPKFLPEHSGPLAVMELGAAHLIFVLAWSALMIELISFFSVRSFVPQRLVTRIIGIALIGYGLVFLMV